MPADSNPVHEREVDAAHDADASTDEGTAGAAVAKSTSEPQLAPTLESAVPAPPAPVPAPTEPGPAPAPTPSDRVRAWMWGRVVWVFHRTPRWIAGPLMRSQVPTHMVGAACLIERDDGRVLLLRQPRPDGKWSLPGGVVDLWEQPATAAVRETKEEVGLDVELTSDAAVMFESGRLQVHVLFRARCRPGSDPDDARPVSPEITQVRWVPVAEALNMPQVIDAAMLELDRQQPRPGLRDGHPEP